MLLAISLWKFMQSDRLPGIDALRILGAILVISLHIRPMSDWNPEVAVDLRLFARWVVPYFCMVLGYFAFSRSGNAEQFVKTLTRLAVITAAATALYVLVAWSKLGVKGAALWIVSPRFFVEGAWFHLWFLNAALIGVVSTAALKTTGLFRHGGWLVAAGLLIGIGTDLLYCWNKTSVETMEAARLFTGVALVLAGARLRDRSPAISLRASLATLAAGAMLTLLQGGLMLHLGANALECQFPPGGLLMGFGFLMLGCHPTASSRVQRLAGWGRRYALGLYLLHPIVILALTKLCTAVDVPRRLELLWPATAISTMLLLVALARYLPKAKAVLDGQVTARPLADPASK